MSDAKITRPKDPDNVYVSEGQKDTSKVYVFVPTNYRDAKAAIKAAGGIWKGSQYEFDKAVFTAVENTIREAARKDIGLGSEGRRSREDELNPERVELRAKKEAEKAEKSAAWQKAKAHRVLIKEGDVPVDEDGNVAGGQQVTTKDGQRPVTSVGRVFQVDEENLARLTDANPEAGVAVGDRVSYAYYAAEDEVA